MEAGLLEDLVAIRAGDEKEKIRGWWKEGWCGYVRKGVEGRAGGEGTLGLKVMSMEANSPLLTNGRECNVRWQNGKCLQKLTVLKRCC